MCTLSVITGNGGYLLAMNRDERIVRAAGELPALYRLNGTTAMYPNDGARGTWIAANEYGIALALLNWNDVASSGIASAGRRSRGRVVPALTSSTSLSDLREALGARNFHGMLPFRLVGVFPSEREIWEWRWDSTQLVSMAHVWQPRHWFSSSLSDKQADSLRAAVCLTARQELNAGSVPWLRRLHASHAGGPGPFSLCVHRDDVTTLSYSEVVVAPGRIRMRHFRGSPCTMAQVYSIEIQGVDRADAAVTSLSYPAG